MTPEKINRIFKRFQKANPTPKIELNYHSPFELLVAVVLSAQTTDKGVNKATTELFNVANTPQKMLSLGEEQLKKYIKTIGLYNSKAKNIIAASQMLIERYQSIVPNNREALEMLPGVGRKSANVILNTAFHQPVIAVDTHVFRVAHRTHLALGKNVIEVEEQLEKTIPSQYKLNTSHWLVLHGRYTCKAKKPECEKCMILDLYEYEKKSP